MKRFFLTFLVLTVSAVAVFAQRIPVVAILPFTVEGRGATPEDAASITSQVITELGSWGTLNIVQAEAGAEYIVRGSVTRQGNNFIVTAQTTDARNTKLNDSREQAAALRDISIFNLCTKIVESVPFPNYLVGTWQSTLNMPDGPVVCIIEFRSNRTIIVERYDTWEHRRNNSLRYEGYGSGTYSYAGYFSHRIMTVNSQQIQIDATAGIYLKLEETLPEQTTVNLGRLGLVFGGDKNSFEFIGGSLPCGRNYDGPSVYPLASIGFTQFTKIR